VLFDSAFSIFSCIGVGLIAALAGWTDVAVLHEAKSSTSAPIVSNLFIWRPTFPGFMS
jgi:hypothetical protein